MSDGTLKLGRHPKESERGPGRVVSFKLDPDTEAALARILDEDSDPAVRTGQLSTTLRRLIIEEDSRRQRKARSPK